MQCLIVEDERKNKINTAHLGLCIKERVDIPSCQKSIEKISVPGRDGELTVEGNYQNMQMEIELNVMKDNIIDEIRNIKSLLLDAKKIFLSDDEDFFYLVKNVSIGDIENEVNFYGSFKINFELDPFAYKSSSFIYNNLNSKLKEDSSFKGQTVFVRGYIAKPLFEFYANNDISLEIDNFIIKIKNPPNKFYLDFDLLACYDSMGLSILDKMQGEFPVFNHGKHTIRCIGSNLPRFKLREGYR